MTKPSILVLLVCALLYCANCNNHDAPACGDEETTHDAQSLPALPNALTRIAYHAAPFTDDASEDTEFRLLDGPDWLSIDPDDGSLFGIPSDTDAHAERTLHIAQCTGRETLHWKGPLRIEHSAKYRDPQGYDAYAHDYDGEQRALRNDLEGAWAAEVQFLQSHSSAPDERNTIDEDDQTQSRYMPAITAQREALLVVLPHENDDIETLDARILLNGEIIAERRMQHPNDLPQADNPTAWNVRYSSRAWSLVLPYDLLREGLSLEFIVNQGAPEETRGTLSKERLHFSPASQLILRSLRLGMLTDPEESQDHFTLNDPILAATDYFQTLPVSQLIVSSYADVRLERVMVRSGVIYDLEHDEASATQGDVYSGDMRENVGKAQVSSGINLANIGVSSHNMSQNYPHGFKQITNHHAWGMYTNDVDGTPTPQRVQHGLSGGNGIGTIIASRGNEASHEWGHAYGLGHYPGQELTDDGRWANHHADSGWGYIQHRRRLRTGITGVQDGALTYNRDAMSGGFVQSPFSQYTYYTGFSARIIQADIAQFPIPSSDSPTGYLTWNADQGDYVPHHSDLRPPKEIGVPVATLLGAYDPVDRRAVIYPVFHGNHGNTFDLQAPDLANDADACWLHVETRDGDVLDIALAAERYENDAANQFHVNLHADKRPVHAALRCQFDGEEHTLDARDFDGEIPELPPVAIVGQEYGIKQLQQREIIEIASALDDLSPRDALDIPPTTVDQIHGFSDDELASSLSDDAWAIVSAFLAIERHAQNIDALINFGLAHQTPEDVLQQQLLQALQDAELLRDPRDLTLTGAPLTLSDVAVSHTPNEDGYIQATALEDATIPDHWTLDAQGKIHPIDSPWLCLTPTSDRLALEDCSFTRAEQRWVHDLETHTLKNQHSNLCIDVDSAGGRLLMYGCHGNWNQQWATVHRTSSAWLAAFSAETLQKLRSILEDKAL